nr:hypothetical protein CFP56_08140 [Quercus suber]
MQPLAGKQHDDRVQEADQRQWRDPSQELLLIPFFAQGPAQRQSRHDRRGQRDAEEHGHRPRGVLVGVVIGVGRIARHDTHEERGERGVERDLQQAVEGNEHGAVVGVAAREVGPDEHHGDAARDADEDEPVTQALTIGQEGPRQRRHEQRRDDPVEHEGDGDLCPQRALAQQEVQRLEAHLAEDRVHHDQQAGGDGTGHADKGPLLERRSRGRHEVPEDDAQCHAEEDPEDEQPVQEGEGFERRWRVCSARQSCSRCYDMAAESSK